MTQASPDSREVPPVVAVDIGGTSVKGAVLLARSDSLQSQRSTATRATGAAGAIPIAEVVGDFVELLAQDVEALTGQRPAAIGVAAPGVVDEAAGIVRMSANLDWSEVALRDRLLERFTIPTVLLHDARAAALGEARFGAARTADEFFFVAIGTGIGASLVLGGSPRPGRHGIAGELGHVIVDPNGAECGCGARGCLETIASAQAVANRYQREAGAQHRGATIDAKEVFRRADLGEEIALRVRDGAITALAAALVTCQSVLDLDLVVLGGGMAEAGEPMARMIEQEIRRTVRFQRVPEVRVSALGSRAGLFGAAAAARSLVVAGPSGPASRLGETDQTGRVHEPKGSP
jgi:glucokinase